MKNIKINNQKGFSILAVILVIVAVIVAIGAWAMSGSTNTSNTSSSKAKIDASSLINDGGSVKLAFDNLVINGTSKDSITYTLDNTATSMLNSATGISVPNPSPSAVKSDAFGSEGFYVYSTKFAPNIPNVNVQRKAIMIGGIKTAVCQQINLTIHGTDSIPVYASFSEARQFTDGATKANPNSAVNIDFKSNGLGALHITEGWTRGCISGTNTNDSNLFFYVLD